MDANGTRFHLMVAESDWSRRHPPRATSPAPGPSWSEARGAASPLRWHASRGGFTLEPLPTELPAPAGGALLSPDQRRGAGCDRYGNWYWIDEDGRTIWVRYAAPSEAGSQEAVVFWPVPREPRAVPADGAFTPEAAQEPIPSPLSGLAVTAHHFLVTFAREPARLLVFDLHAGGPPLALPWPEASHPFDVAPVPEPLRKRADSAADGGALVLDRERREVWILDRQLAVRGSAAPAAPSRSEDFGAHGAPGPRVAPAAGRIPVDLTRDGEELDPVAVEALDGDLYVVLDRAGARVLLHRGASRIGEVPLPGGYVPHDLAAAPDAAQDADAEWRGTLYVASAEGNQSYAYRLVVRSGAPELAPLPDHFPMRSFGGKALSGGPAGPAYDVRGAMVPLASQPRPRYAREGSLLTGVLEGDGPGCVWHRLLLDASVPPGCSICVESRACDDEAALTQDLSTVPFQREPGPRLRASGPEVPWVGQLPGAASGTWELLFQQARGRFLQLRITLRGPGIASARICALRAWYPRFSWLGAYLPAVWRGDTESAHLVDRLLANPEGLYTALEDRIASAQILFHPDATPPEALDWLASWVALALDPRWEDRRKRLLLRFALDFYRWRGTARGLVMALRVALDASPDERIFREPDPLRWPIRIVERFRTAQLSPVALGDPSALTSGPGSWTPERGVGRLLDAYRQALEELALTPLPDRFPTAAPPDDRRAQAWRGVARDAFGFVPTSGPAAARAWREFLARRYPTFDAMRAAHASAATSFAEVELPEELPERAAILADWWEFQAIAERARLRAHQFTVVLPVALGDDAEHQRQTVELARRLVELEKPAHAIFDVKLYWVAFRVGEARAGIDTVVGLGGRSPELMRPMVLDRGHVGESYLAHGPPQDATDRLILGRDRLRQPKESP